jgi:hypothetical protein
LQQPLLRVQSDASSPARFCLCTSWASVTSVTDISIEQERPALVLLPMAVRPFACLDQGFRCLPGGLDLQTRLFRSGGV